MSPAAKSWAFVIGTTGLLGLWLAFGPPVLARPENASITVLGVRLNQPGTYFTTWALGLYIGGIAGLLVLRARAAVSLTAFVALLLGGAAFVIGAKLHYRIETLGFWQAVHVHANEILDPGMRLPLGLLLSGVIACAAAAVCQAPWRETGDAWAVAASVFIPIGRIGCFLVGCCTGSVCGRWAAPFCLTYPPGSEAYSHQVVHQLIAPSSAVSLPVHPLPLYFAAASLCTLAVLLSLLRRKASPGALLAAFCILRPLAKLALEPLRADPRPGVLMIVIPAGVLVGTVAILAFGALRRLEKHRVAGASFRSAKA